MTTIETNHEVRYIPAPLAVDIHDATVTANNTTLNQNEQILITLRPAKVENQFIHDLVLSCVLQNTTGAGGGNFQVPHLASLLSIFNVRVNGILIFSLPDRSFNLANQIMESIAHESHDRDQFTSALRQAGFQFDGGAAYTSIATMLASKPIAANTSTEPLEFSLRDFLPFFRSIRHECVHQIDLEIGMASTSELQTRISGTAADFSKLRINEIALRAHYTTMRNGGLPMMKWPAVMMSKKFYTKVYTTVPANSQLTINVFQDFPLIKMAKGLKLYMTHKTDNTLANNPWSAASLFVGAEIRINGQRVLELDTNTIMRQNMNRHTVAELGRHSLYPLDHGLFHLGYPLTFSFMGLTTPSLTVGSSRKHKFMGGINTKNRQVEIILYTTTGADSYNLTAVIEADGPALIGQNQSVSLVQY